MIKPKTYLFKNIWKEITDLIEKNRELDTGSVDYYLNNLDIILATMMVIGESLR